MNEDRWRTCDHPHTLLQFLAGQISDRQFLLLACGIVRRLEHLLVEPRSVAALAHCEDFADGAAATGDLHRATELAMQAGLAARAERERAQAAQKREEEFHPLRPTWWDATEAVDRCDDRENAAWLVWRVAYELLHPGSGDFPREETIGGPLDPAALAEFAAEHVIDIATKDADKEADTAFRRSVCAIIRCVAGNPFRPSDLGPGWATWHGGTIPQLAQTIREGRDFGRLPILADALEEAGCAPPDVLEHCRGPGPHVRGCWVIDLLTLKR